ncbi:MULTISPECIES: pseudouridine synthase [unclassified Spirosoma]|uniref:pseudouridine synthase n=1 Tax=unclassified Spirosoma TaxID=2621999 RepID=UPI000960CD78|nr:MULTISPECIES: pseudouridine synthase [unclassified Spirosoma]MBN8822112.1 pseudouridine synthase [Spirosoma sp.]OJW80510.1 MAG: pseudouridine synthase [Spirosoma sp. 48-14]
MYYLIYKPYLMLSQFSREGDKPTLADLDFDFPKDVYPVGRLDADSEGLLLLTSDKQLNHRLLNPKFRHHRTYYVQVEGALTQQASSQLAKGVTISVDGKPYHTLPATAQIIPEPALPERNPPIRYRVSIPTSWLSISLHEGKNRQVRKMTASVGFPTLRLARWAIESLTADGMKSGDVRELSRVEVMQGLNL